VEADWLDCVREPRILAISTLRLDDLRDESRCVLLWDRQQQRCPFIEFSAEQKSACTIYPTRPNDCVACEPGGPKCQQARLLAGRAVLRDTAGAPPNVEIWATEAEFDETWLQEITAAVLAALEAERQAEGSPTQQPG
jgi:Fe-S-cluster containining protein